MTEFPKPKIYKGRVSKIVHLNYKVVELSISIPEEMIFLAGQFISLKVSDKFYRSYSISTSPSNKNLISILVAVGHEGVGSNYVKSLQVGDEVTFIGPSGRFVLPETIGNDLFFIATGTGIGPLLSMMKFLSEKKCDSNISLLFGIRDDKEIFAIDEIRKLKDSLKNFEYKICFSQLLPTNIENAFIGRVTDHMRYVKTAQYFICGNPFMVQEVTQSLLQNEIPAENIHREKFTVAQKPVIQG